MNIFLKNKLHLSKITASTEYSLLRKLKRHTDRWTERKARKSNISGLHFIQLRMITGESIFLLHESLGYRVFVGVTGTEQLCTVYSKQPD